MAFSALDTSQNSRNLVPCLVQKGIVAIGRYYTRRRTNSKILTADEAQRLSNAGIKIWPVYQNTHRAESQFSAAIGQSEARDALDYATNVIRQPRGTAIYFSADFDVTVGEFNRAVRPHFEAIAAAFAAAGNPYRIGVYSSGAVCKSLLDAGTVQLTWLSQSSGFRGTRDFKQSRRWNLLQFLGVPNFCNFRDEIDPDEFNNAAGDFGGFLLPATAAPAAGPASATMASGARAPAAGKAKKRVVRKAAKTRTKASKKTAKNAKAKKAKAPKAKAPKGKAAKSKKAKRGSR